MTVILIQITKKILLSRKIFSQFQNGRNDSDVYINHEEKPFSSQNFFTISRFLSFFLKSRCATSNFKGVIQVFVCTQFDVLNFFRLVTKIAYGCNDSDNYTNHEEKPTFLQDFFTISRFFFILPEIKVCNLKLKRCNLSFCVYPVWRSQLFPASDKDRWCPRWQWDLYKSRGKSLRCLVLSALACL